VWWKTSASVDLTKRIILALSGWVHMPRIPKGGYTRTQCEFLVTQLERERGGKWKHHFLEEPDATIKGLGHCSFERIED